MLVVRMLRGRWILCCSNSHLHPAMFRSAGNAGNLHNMRPHSLGPRASRKTDQLAAGTFSPFAPREGATTAVARSNGTCLHRRMYTSIEPQNYA